MQWRSLKFSEQKMAKKIVSELGINFDVSKLTSELNKLEKRLGDVSGASIDAEKSAQGYRIEQEKIKFATALARKEIDKQVQELKTQAVSQKASAEAAKAAASEKKTAADLESNVTRLMKEQNITMQNELRKTELAQAKSADAVEKSLREKELAYKKEALAARLANAKIREELAKTKAKNIDASRGFNLLKNAVAAIGVGVAAKGFINLADRAQFLENRVKVATGSVEEMNTSLEALRKLSRETGSSLENNAILFQRLAIASESLGATNKDMLKLTKTVANLGRLSGSSTEDMKNSTRQLAQALGNTKLQAEEFNSVIDQMPELVQVVAKEMGKTSAEFGNAVRSGEILSKDVYDALIKKADEVNERAERLPLTFGQAREVLNNELIIALGEVNERLGVTRTLAGGMKLLADNSDELTMILKGTVIAVGTLSSAWLAYTAAAAAAELSTKKLSLSFGPAGWIAVGVGTVASLALTWASFKDEVAATSVDMGALADQLRKASTSAEALAVHKSHVSQMKVLFKSYDTLIKKKEELESEKLTRGGTGRFKNTKTDAGRALDAINIKIEAAKKEMQAVNDLVAQASDKVDFFKGSEGAADAIEATKQEKKKFEQIKKSLETEKNLAVQAFEEKNSYIQKFAANDNKERARLVAANASDLKGKLDTIAKEENADKDAREKKYLALVDSYKTEKELLLKSREDERALIEEFSYEGDDKEGKLQKLRDFYSEKLAIIEKAEQDKDNIVKNKADADLAAERDKLGYIGQFLNQEVAIRKKANGDKLSYAVQTGKLLLADSDQTNRKMFEATKAFQLAEAVVLGWKAIQMAYASAPAPYSFALAAITAAKVAVQINGIKNTKFGGGGTPSASGGGSSPPAETASAAPAQNQPQFNQSIQIAVDVGDIDEDGIYTGKAVRLITEEIARQIEAGITNVGFANG